MLTETFLRYGQPKPPVELVRLRAGPLTLLYDPVSGMVRRIKLDEREVLRGIYAAVRDHNWGTVPARIRETVRSIESESFHLEFESEHQQGDIHFVWRGVIHGDTDGTLRYKFDGEAKNSFLRNRIGFCVLHPIAECAGAHARQTRMDDSTVECRFPDLIEPQIIGRSSFQQLRAVAHEVASEVWAQVDFEGDVFEMEDQRNWTDASFKSYCTPLALPFPVEVKQRTRIRQAVTLRLSSRRRDEADSSGDRAVASSRVGGCVTVASDSIVTLTIPEVPNVRLPRLGLGVASHGESLTETEVAKLRKLGLSHLRVDVRLAAQDWPATLERAAHDAARLSARLELALHLPRDGEFDGAAVARALEPLAAMLLRVFALRDGEPATSDGTLASVRKLLGTIPVPVGCGSDCNFCELNREHTLGRAAVAEADFVFWSVNPQVHAFDHLSIMETLEAQSATVHSARAFARNRPLVVSPVTLKQRFNPVATNSRIATAPAELPPQVDPRQLSRFAAAWTLGSLASLASAGVESATFYETTGWRGVMELLAGSSLPEKFPSIPGAVYPVFNALSDLTGFSEVAVVPTCLPQELSVMALFGVNRASRVLIANLSETARRVKIVVPGIPPPSVEVNPYNVARIDLSL